MFRRRSRVCLACLVWGVAAVSGCATTPASSMPNAVQRDVLDAEQRWWHAVAAGDVEGALSQVSDDAVLIGPQGSAARGRGVLADYIRRSSSEPNQLLGDADQVEIRSSDLAVVSGRLRWTRAGAVSEVLASGRYVDTWRLGDRGWQLVSWRTIVSDCTSPQSPARDENGPVVRRFLDAWSTGDWASLESLIRLGYVGHTAAGNRDREGLRKRFEAFHRFYSTVRFDVQEQLSTADRVVTRSTAILTEAGTGRTVRHAVVHISRVVDGQIAEQWETWEPITAPGGGGTSVLSPRSGGALAVKLR